MASVDYERERPVGEMFLARSPAPDAWEPTLQEFAELCSLAARDRLCHSHTNYGRWSFWKPCGRSVVICQKTGRAYAVTAEGKAYWVSKEEALEELGLEFLGEGEGDGGRG